MIIIQTLIVVMFFIIGCLVTLWLLYLIDSRNKSIQRIKTNSYYIGLYHRTNNKDFKYVRLEEDRILVFCYKRIEFSCTGYYASVGCEVDSKNNMDFISKVLCVSDSKERVYVSIIPNCNDIIYGLTTGEI